jgi:hypothetical protein
MKKPERADNNILARRKLAMRARGAATEIPRKHIVF